MKQNSFLPLPVGASVECCARWGVAQGYRRVPMGTPGTVVSVGKTGYRVHFGNLGVTVAEVHEVKRLPGAPLRTVIAD